MNKLQKIIEKYPDEEFLKADGLDDAVIGFSNDFILVYDSEKCIELLIEDNELDYEDAVDYFYFNIAGAYMGEKTPIFINLIDKK
jgi:hypothetical protein